MKTNINKNLYHFATINYKKEEDIKLYTRIGKTPFEVKDSYTKNLSLDYDVYSPDNIIINIRQMLKFISNYDMITMKVLLTFVYYLEPNTNFVSFNKNSVSVVISNSHTSNAIQENSAISVAIRQLTIDNIIAKTNKRELYIINHNYFYKGDLNKFAENYRKLYGNWVPAETDDKNKIILAKNNKDITNACKPNIKLEKALKLLDTQTTKFKVIK